MSSDFEVKLELQISKIILLDDKSLKSTNLLQYMVYGQDSVIQIDRCEQESASRR